MYCEYWNLHKAPFDNVPDPSMYANCHTSMENVISETVFAIKEADEAFAVIIGAVGSGKTLSLRIIIDSLDRVKYKVVTIANPGISFAQLLKEIISQVTGQPCAENRKVHLLETFHRLLFTTMEQGQKIIIFIDEANTLSPANLENLRLLTNMQDDQRNLFTLVLAGQMELAQRLEHPKRVSLFQRIGTYGRIDKLPSELAVKEYIETRLKLAGTKIKIFSDDCVPIIWEHSENGIPRLINKICKLCLKAGETNNYDYISAGLVLQISESFQKLSKPAIQKRKPRSIPDDFEISDVIMMDTEVNKILPTIIIPNKEACHKKDELIQQTTAEQKLEEITLANEIFATELPSKKSLLEASLQKTIIATQSEHENIPLNDIITDEKTEKEITEPILKTTTEPKQETILLASEIPSTEISVKESLLEMSRPISIKATQSESENTPLPESIPDAETLRDIAKSASAEVSEVNIEDNRFEYKKHQQLENENYDEVVIGEYKIYLAIPKDILKQVKSFNRESANKSAGFWAAQIIKKNPQLTRSALVDPVYIWNEIKDNILKRIAP